VLGKFSSEEQGEWLDLAEAESLHQQRGEAFSSLPICPLSDMGLCSLSYTKFQRRDPLMGTQDNKQIAVEAYSAFAGGDAEGAMRNIDDSIEWTARGDNALSGTYHGKQEVGELWAKLSGKEFSSKPHDFIADGNKVVVLTSVSLEGETSENADVLTYNSDGKLIAFETIGDTAVADRVFAK